MTVLASAAESGDGSVTAGFRADGATRADRLEAIALLVTGVALLALPLLALLDRMAEGWLWFCGLLAVSGLFVGGLGLRWFLVQGPALLAAPAAEEAELAERAGAAPMELPVNVRLVEARNRLRAHVLRFAALGAGALLLALELGPLKWAVVALFLSSFVADHLLLRPQRYVIDSKGLSGSGLFARGTVPWAAVRAAYWRHYPGKERPPWPSGERVILERDGAGDLEFVFHRRYGGTEPAQLARILRPLLEERLRVLRPGGHRRADLQTPDVSELMGSPEAAHGAETDRP
jgi:hypothetical protein